MISTVRNGPRFASGLVDEVPGEDGGVIFVQCPVCNVLSIDKCPNVILVDLSASTVHKERSMALSFVSFDVCILIVLCVGISVFVFGT